MDKILEIIMGLLLVGGAVKLYLSMQTVRSITQDPEVIKQDAKITEAKTKVSAAQEQVKEKEQAYVDSKKAFYDRFGKYLPKR